MQKITDAERKMILEELAEEFPGDAMMQELHLVRRIHQLKTEGMGLPEKIAYYRRRAQRLRESASVPNGR